MTRREKSDAQLDAEAQGRVVNPALRKPLTRWRVGYHMEAPPRTTSSRPPEMTEEFDGVKFRVIDPGAGIGQTMAGHFLRYLDVNFPTQPEGNHFPADLERPIHSALSAWDRECRKSHARWADHLGRPVCAELAWHVIRDRWSIFGAANEAGVSFPRAEALLQIAVAWMAKRQDRWMQAITPSVSHDREACALCRAEDANAA